MQDLAHDSSLETLSDLLFYLFSDQMQSSNRKPIKQIEQPEAEVTDFMVSCDLQTFQDWLKVDLSSGNFLTTKNTGKHTEGYGNTIEKPANKGKSNINTS